MGTEFKKFVTPVFRASFPALAEPESFDNGPLKYSITALWTPAIFTAKDKERYKAIVTEMNAQCKAKFGKGLKELPSSFKLGIRNGEDKDLEGYGEGVKFANITTKRVPGVVDAKRAPLVGAELAREIYPGCYCRATVTVYTFDNKGKGVALGLLNVQKIADGERLDTVTDAADDFEDDIDEKWLQEAEGVDMDDDLDGEIPF